MDTPNKNMYHFVWNDDDHPFDDEQQLSPKERVAKILKETELEDIPDLQFRTKDETKKIKNLKKTYHKPFELKSDHELFSIGDDSDNGSDDFDFDARLEINNGDLNTKVPSNSQKYKQKRAAKVPPMISVHHPKRGDPPPQTETDETSADTYIVDAVNSSVVYGTSRGSSPKRDNKTSSLLPMAGGKFLEDMDFDDDIDSGVAVEDDHEDDNGKNQDTVPIVTVDQVQLSERWRKRRQKINFIVAFALLAIGLAVLITAVILIVKMIQGQ